MQYLSQALRQKSGKIAEIFLPGTIRHTVMPFLAWCLGELPASARGIAFRANTTPILAVSPS
jgi:hypothetical protein